MSVFYRRLSSLSRTSKQQRKQRTRRRNKLRFESLESRNLLAVVTWDGGGGDSSWHNAANWTDDTLPGPSDDVVIVNATVAVNDDDVSIASLHLHGTLTSDKQITIQNHMKWYGGEMRGTGTLEIAAGGTLDLLDDHVRVLNAWTLTSKGNTNWFAGSFLTGNSATFNNVGTFTIHGTQDHNFDYDYRLGEQPATFNNIGTFNQPTGSALIVLDARLNNSGSVNVDGGEFRNGLRGGGTSSGSFNAASGTILGLWNTHQFTASSSIVADTVNLYPLISSPTTIAGSYAATGTTTVGAGGDYNGRVNFIGSVDIEDAALHVSGSASFANPVSVASLELGPQSDSALLDSGTIEVTGHFNWISGHLLGGGTLTVAPGATLEITANSDRVFEGWTLNNEGSATWSGGNFRTGDGATFNNIGTFTVQGAQDHIFEYDYRFGEQPATFNNTGTFNQPAGSGLTVLDSRLNNSGSVNVSSGEWRNGYRGGGTSSGSFNADPGTILGLWGSHHLTGSSIIDADTVNLYPLVSVATIIDGSYSATGTTTIGAGGDYNGRASFTGSVDNIGSTLNISGTADFPGSYSHTFGAIVLIGGTLEADEAIELLVGSLQGTGIVNANLVNSSTVSPGTSAGQIRINRSYTQTGAGTYEVEIAGTQLSQYDRLVMSEGATLAGELNVEVTAEIQVGDVFTVIANDGPGAISGTFSGLVDGAIVSSASGHKFQISYGGHDANPEAGGNGNDVTLTCVFVPPDVITVDIDVHNESLNLGSNATILVTLFGSEDLAAESVDVSTVRLADAAAWQSSLVDVNNDGRLDLQLKFRAGDGSLEQIYADLLNDDHNEDGVLDSTHQLATLALTGETVDEVFFEGTDDLDLFLTGKALRNLLKSLFG